MLTNDTDYYLEKNYGDTTKQILELRKNGESKRIMGFEKKVRNMELGWFVDKNYYNKASAVIELPMKNCKKATENAGNQLYPKNISLEKMWNVICIITGKRDQMLQI